MEWKDVFAEAIATVAVVVTVVTVLVAWLLSQTYASHVDELRNVKGEYRELLEKLQTVVGENEAVTNKTVLSLRTLFDLVMIKSRAAAYERRLEMLVKTGEWRGASLTADQVAEKAGLIRSEIDRVDHAARARETELYWLVGTATEQTAHLYALIDTTGDEKSLTLLENFALLAKSGGDKDDMLEAVAGLRQRLGKPRRLKKLAVLSSRWTGREEANSKDDK